MTSLEPLKSVISIGMVDDTSLALPAGDGCQTGQRRVQQQVQTVRRSRSRQSSCKSGTSLSPTTPTFDSAFIETSKCGTSNGGLFFGNGFSKTISLEKNLNRQCEVDVTRWRSATTKASRAPAERLVSNRSSYRAERASGQFVLSPTSPSQPHHALYPGYGTGLTKTNGQFTTSQVNVTKTLPRPGGQFILCPTAPSQPHNPLYPGHGTGLISPITTGPVNVTKTLPRPGGQFILCPTAPSQPHNPLYPGHGTGLIIPITTGQVKVTKTLPRLDVTDGASKKDSGSNGKSGAADLTMEEAVQCLRHDDEAYQHCGASYIQHSTFMDDEAKEEVLKLKGIPPLVGLLRSSSPLVNQTASAALRNLSFKSDVNKEEIHRLGGVADAAALLREADSVESQKQLTGLLWNLSSVESLKPELLKSALPVLMERAILPYTAGPDRISGSNQDPEVFFNATGCLRNLSSTKQSNRQAMRKCRGLIDSLVSYVKECVEEGKPDDKSAENCVCVLNNLTFRLQEEAPVLFSRINMLVRDAGAKDLDQGYAGPIGCFSPQSRSSEQEGHFDFPIIEDAQPSGAGQLIHSQTMESYLSLLDTSQLADTQEACFGALQNLTANEGKVSGVMGQTIVQKLNGLHIISPLLKSNHVDMKRNAVALVGNLTKNSNLHHTIARSALPELLSIIRAGTAEGNESDDTLAMACQTSNRLLMKEPQEGKHLLDYNLVVALKDLSQNGYFPKSSKAAALLLYNMWSEKDLQSFLKKKGFSKSLFVTDITTAAYRSAQVID